jgi:hypothetical protein
MNVLPVASGETFSQVPLRDVHRAAPFAAAGGLGTTGHDRRIVAVDSPGERSRDPAVASNPRRCGLSSGRAPGPAGGCGRPGGHHRQGRQSGRCARDRSGRSWLRRSGPSRCTTVCVRACPQERHANKVHRAARVRVSPPVPVPRLPRRGSCSMPCPASSPCSTPAAARRSSTSSAASTSTTAPTSRSSSTACPSTP